MSDQHRPPRPATLKDLQAILSHAAKHPAERQRLADASEDVLQQAGLRATPDAIEFLRSLGQAKFDEGAQATKLAKNDSVGGMGEM
jgi:hypothetical protein